MLADIPGRARFRRRTIYLNYVTLAGCPALVCGALALRAQQPPRARKRRPRPSPKKKSSFRRKRTTKIPKEYSFNPVQSKKEVTVGEFYFKKGDFKAAAGRFREATKWNDGNAEAWLRLGDAEEKLKMPKRRAKRGRSTCNSRRTQSTRRK